MKQHKTIKVWLSKQVALQAQNIFVLCPVFMCMGILAYFGFGYNLPTYLGLFVMALLVAGYFRNSKVIVQKIYIGLLFFALGFSCSQLRTAFVDAPILKRNMKFSGVSGRIVDIEWNGTYGKSARVTLDHVNIDDVEPDEMPYRVRLNLRTKDKIEGITIGSIVRGTAYLHVLSAPIVPGGFDFRRYFYYKKRG